MCSGVVLKRFGWFGVFGVVWGVSTVPPKFLSPWLLT